MSAKLVPVTPGTPEWMDRRRNGIGASDIAPILGISPWTSAYTLYYRKLGLADEEPDNEAMEWGRALESLILNRFAHRHPEVAVNPAGLYQSAAQEWQLATPDGLVYDHDPDEGYPIAVVEVKTAARKGDEWGVEGTDEIPPYYRAQVQWAMHVLEVGTCYVPVLFAGRHYAEYVVEYDPADVEVMCGAVAQFWQRIQDKEPPEVDWLPSTTRTLRRLHPHLCDDEADMPEEAVADYRNWREIEKTAKQRKAQAENQIRDALGDRAYGVLDGKRVVTRSIFDRHGIDMQRLRDEYPDLAEDLECTTTIDRVNVTEAK